MKKKRIVSVLVVTFMLLVTFQVGIIKAEDNDSGYVVGFSNSFNGNSYRQLSEKMLRNVSDELVASGVLKKDIIFAEANQNLPKQVQQIQAFIQQGVDAIIIDPGSSTALNGVLRKASQAGIPCIIVNDGPVNSNAELVYQINFNLKDITGILTKYIAEKLNGKGNIIELRGQAGTESDKLMHQGVLDVLADYPEINIVAEVYTDWTGAKAQTELASVLPTIDDKIDAIVTQGGDSYAAVQVFEKTNRELPIIGGDNRGYFLRWWANEAPEGYETLSVSANPWNVAAGLYVAIDILNGVDVPHEISFPIAQITTENIDNYSEIKPESIGAPTYDHQWVKETLY